jgi:ABC-2 type transport system permease protein
MAVRKNVLRAHLSLLYENTKMSLKSAMEYKFNFMMQTVGMIVNDVFWLALWWLLFARFQNISGWDFKDVLLMYSFLTVTFGLASTLFYGSRKLYKTITEGRLDYYLTLPKNILFHSSLKTSYSALGDLIFGIALIPLSLTLAQLPLYIYFIITGTVLFVSVTIIFNSLALFFGNSERAAQTGDEAFLSFASYPFSAFGGMTKFILLTLFPAGFITGIPVQTIKDFSVEWSVMAGLISLVFLAIAVAVFYYGLKRYESGNLLYSKD